MLRKCQNSFCHSFLYQRHQNHSQKSKFMNIMSFETEDDVTWLQEHQETDFFTMIYDC